MRFPSCWGSPQSQFTRPDSRKRVPVATVYETLSDNYGQANRNVDFEYGFSPKGGAQASCDRFGGSPFRVQGERDLKSGHLNTTSTTSPAGNRVLLADLNAQRRLFDIFRDHGCEALGPLADRLVVPGVGGGYGS